MVNEKMKVPRKLRCHCKLCQIDKTFYCLTTNQCYFRQSLKPYEIKDDYGCIGESAFFLCNDKSNNEYKTICCKTNFCNTPDLFHQNVSTMTTTIGRRNITTKITAAATILYPSTQSVSLHEMESKLIIVAAVLGSIVCALLIWILNEKIQTCFRTLFASSSSNSSRKKPLLSLCSDGKESNSDKQQNVQYLSPQGSEEYDTTSWYTSSCGKTRFLNVRRMSKEVTLLYPLAKGRHACVWLGDISNQNRALKMFTTRYESEYNRERAIYENVLTCHPNILSFFGADLYSNGINTFYMIITEYHELGSLQNVLSKSKSITIDTLMKYSTSAANGLQHLHSTKYATNDRCKPRMAHCDIKSSNILVKSNGECCLSDFSWSIQCDPNTQKIIDPSIKTRGQVGTVIYMAPELLNNTFRYEQITSYQQADIYSFALVLWEMFNCTSTTMTDSSIEYSLPYVNQLPLITNPTLNDVRDIVCQKEIRPVLDQMKCNQNEVLLAYSNLIRECWSKCPDERRSASSLQRKLYQIQQNTISSSSSI
ncbi:unnamed protein product [Didymodactylos carnosus]|uniref:receptor protein serine/threonine kinase n=1 Tax=Didymodactylos carnosus TaxID=1234261 RepID=A0A814FFG8_9BILA|nr:unnamed protein product [Didymodactylos carnosus]CAF1193973.1 unnamed protein product [Didymodactylos carnosus]CAF3753589.1 unnamed protein product [Didymodactylos carnosus]CAF4004243.1 unnamed protein product [Didymodactylos carnosus]